ncbi:MAG: xanthine phosphoribosyltransferase [Oscillospiraceae bacterium]|jgi:xanthine phosphoribosyltransferase|nr:xanthine phosphoribosyltransferase [Oscillospiraceae bacterium]
MEFMTRRIAQDGRALDGNVLLVDSFLNHQVDMGLMQQIGQAFADRFKGAGITRVLTIESSGIAPAGMTALALGVPLVVLKKRTSRITNGTVYQTNVQSFTKNTQYELTVSAPYLPRGEKVLFIDDFLAMGEAALGAARLVREAGCEIAGIGIVIEKTFQPGRKRLDEAGYSVFSLARIARMSAEGIDFVD